MSPQMSLQFNLMLFDVNNANWFNKRHRNISLNMMFCVGFRVVAFCSNQVVSVCHFGLDIRKISPHCMFPFYSYQMVCLPHLCWLNHIPILLFPLFTTNLSWLYHIIPNVCWLNPFLIPDYCYFMIIVVFFLMDFPFHITTIYSHCISTFFARCTVRFFVGRPPQKASAGGAPWEKGHGFWGYWDFIGWYLYYGGDLMVFLMAV